VEATGAACVILAVRLLARPASRRIQTVSGRSIGG